MGVGQDIEGTVMFPDNYEYQEDGSQPEDKV